jgi:hypothetical protein
MMILLRYEIRTVRPGNVFSSATNSRLYERARALRIVKRLERSGVDAVLGVVRLNGWPT